MDVENLENIDKVHAAVDLLDSFTPGRLPPKLFEAIARVAVYPAVEFIPLRRCGEATEVLLLRRPKDDIKWPMMWHTPGTVLRPTDKSLDDAFGRLYDDELKGVVTDAPLFIGAHLSENARGRVLLLEYLVVVRGDSGVGRFYDVESLPDGFIGDQYASLSRAVEVFGGMR